MKLPRLKQIIKEEVKKLKENRSKHIADLEDLDPTSFNSMGNIGGGNKVGDNCGCGSFCAGVHPSDCRKCCANTNPISNLREQPNMWYSTFERRAEQVPGMAGSGIINCTFINNRVNHWNNKLSNAGPKQRDVLISKLNHVRTTPTYNCCQSQTCVSGRSWFNGQGVI